MAEHGPGEEHPQRVCREQPVQRAVQRRGALRELPARGPGQRGDGAASGIVIGIEVEHRPRVEARKVQSVQVGGPAEDTESSEAEDAEGEREGGVDEKLRGDVVWHVS